MGHKEERTSKVFALPARVLIQPLLFKLQWIQTVLIMVPV